MENNKKYELTEETIEVNGHILHRIKALRDITRFIKAGTLGGFIEREENLSHEGNCWVADNAKVFENAKVYGNAMVIENAKVYGNAKVYAKALIGCYAQVYENAKVHGDAFVLLDTHVNGNSDVCHLRRIRRDIKKGD